MKIIMIKFIIIYLTTILCCCNCAPSPSPAAMINATTNATNAATETILSSAERLMLPSSEAVVELSPSSSSSTSPTSEILRDLQQIPLKRIAAADPNRIGNITRNHRGDIFYAIDTPKCDTDMCIGLSSGTADVHKNEIKEIDMSSMKSNPYNFDKCECQCASHLTTFREDLSICVDDIHECTLASFTSGSSAERIPFVFLPLRGQIIHPSKEIAFPGVLTPICAVSGSQFLTNTGWSELRSQIDADVPFRLFRDEGRTFLQWLGEPELRHRMQGRLILVHLLCRDVAPFGHENHTKDAAHQNDLLAANQHIFTPCVAFRVVGTPVKHVNNVTEVSFSSEHIDPEVVSAGLTTKEYIVIGICSLLLGLIYIASVMLYLHMKKRRSESHSGSMRNPKSEINYPKNEEVTFGTGFNRNDSLNTYGRTAGNQNRMMGNRNTGYDSGGRGRLSSGSSQQNINMAGGHHHRTHGTVSTNKINIAASDEHVIVKSNPLLNHFAGLNENPNFNPDMTDPANPDHEEDMQRVLEKLKTLQQTAAMVHPNQNNSPESERNSRPEGSISPHSQENECLPQEDVSIIEDLSHEDKLENMRAIVSGTMRRKLYFNPAYFEPHLLQQPPPAAIEFLTKIREVITIAKYKMSAKRFQPSLNLIPEEISNSETHSNSNKRASRQNSTISMKRANTRNSACSGCPGCTENKTPDAGGNCKNCGDKRNSIRKWLEGVSQIDENGTPNSDFHDHYTLDKTTNKLRESETSSSSDNDTIKANSIRSKNSSKGKAPPIPTNSPDHKIINSDDHDNYNNQNRSTEKIYAKSFDDPYKSSNYGQIEIYHKLTRNAGDLFNNPQFQHTSPILSHRTKLNRYAQKSKGSRKHVEVLDQFSNPNDHHKNYEMIRNIHHMPDMIYEAMAMDYTKLNNSLRSVGRNKQYGMSLPTPDYQLTDDEAKSKKNIELDDPYVPTPDYHTIGRVPKRPHYQPDSPIYSRKSPHYLIVDYETDSLERTSSKKNRNSNSPQTGSSSSESQASPSLSNALPLEEEVEIGNAVYDQVEGFRKDADPIIKKSLMYEDVAKMYSRNLRMIVPPKPAKVKYNTPHEGSMTIEVDHSPQEYDISTDSDQFEPDTLDRKPKKTNPNTNRTVWGTNKSVTKSQENLNHGTQDDSLNYPSLENLTSLPDLHSLTQHDNHLVLKSSGSFKSDLIMNHNTNGSSTDISKNTEKVETTNQRSFSSLREIYEAKNNKNLLLLQKQNAFADMMLEKGRLLTLDARHSKRQRKTNDGSLKKAMVPPDVVPPSYLKHSQRIYNAILQGEIIDESSDQQIENNHMDYISNDFFKDYSKVDKLSKFNSLRKSPEAKEIISESNGCFINEMEDENRYGILENFMTLGDVHNKHFLNSSSTDNQNSDNESIRSITTNSNNNIDQEINPKDNNDNILYDLNKIEILSSNNNSLKSNKMIDESLTTAKIFRVEINPSTNGMQIALGLKDRVKKSKDIKNAWKRFMSIATSKFNTGGSSSSTKNDDSIYDKDDCLTKTLANRLSPRSELDSGYISTDSSESKLQYHKYERYNFKIKKSGSFNSSGNDKNNIYDVIEDIKEVDTSKENSKQSTPTQDRSVNSSSKNCILEIKDASMTGMTAHGYLLDDDRYHSSDISSSVSENDDEDDDESDTNGNDCESGAESIETHSVLFKNIRKQ